MSVIDKIRVVVGAERKFSLYSEIPFSEKSKMLYNTCPETLSFGDTRHRQMGQQFSVVSFIKMIHIALLGTLKTHNEIRG
jgi:hypothetical protein